MLDWLLKFTKIGSAFEKVDEFLNNKKTYIVGVATVVPALSNILLSVHHLTDLLSVTHTADWTQLMLGIGMITGRAALSKASN